MDKDLDDFLRYHRARHQRRGARLVILLTWVVLFAVLIATAISLWR